MHVSPREKTADVIKTQRPGLLWLICWILISVGIGIISRPLTAADNTATLALTGAVIFDGTGATLREGTILIRGRRIDTIGPRDEISLPAESQTIDLSGHWIIPGLIDAHVHFFQSGSLYTRPDVIDLRRIWPYRREIAWIRSRLPATLTRYLASGVTSVVDMAGPAWIQTVRELAERTPTAPRVAVTGPGLAPELPPALRGEHAPAVVVGSPQEAAIAVQRLALGRPDLIKIWFVARPDMDLEHEFAWIRAAVDTSHGLGLRVAAHATELELARRMVQAGIDILVHSVDDKPVDDAFLELLLRHDVLYVTTLSVSEGYREVLSQDIRLSAFERELGDPQVIASLDDLAEQFTAYRPPPMPAITGIAQHNLTRVHAAGIRVVAGSDAGNIGTLHGPALHRELELMAQAGLTPSDILLAATRHAADTLGRAHELGTLQPGKLADMVILDADPLKDIRHTRRIVAVMKDGVLYRPEELMARF